MREKILIFTDLEGTLLKEEDGQYNEEEMFKFLKQISRLERLENATAEIHIVSPMFAKQIQAVLNRLDKTFMAYNRATGENVSCVESAIAFQGGYIDFDCRDNDDRILLMKYKNPNLYGAEKANYVESFIETYKNRNAKRFIYMGNGKNDILAMRKIKRNNGVVICPSNSETDVKLIADYRSDKRDLSGITDGFVQLCEEIEQSKLHIETASKQEPCRPNPKAHTDPDEEER